MDWHLTLAIFPSHAQYSQNRFWIHHDPDHCSLKRNGIEMDSWDFRHLMPKPDMLVVYVFTALGYYFTKNHLWLHMQLQVFYEISLSAFHIWILIFLSILLGKITQALSDWVETIDEKQFSSLATSSQSD